VFYSGLLVRFWVFFSRFKHADYIYAMYTPLEGVLGIGRWGEGESSDEVMKSGGASHGFPQGKFLAGRSGSISDGRVLRTS
jgi:hypothetical protein